MKLKIKVTKEIIKRSAFCGYQIDGVNSGVIGANCAVALAVRDIFPRALVGTHDMVPNPIILWQSQFAMQFDQDKSETIDLPAKAKKFIDEFDKLDPEARLSMKEFEFQIKLTDRTIEETVNIDEIKELLVNHPTLQLV